MSHISNEQINQWLNKGSEVRSIAMGRVGRVLEVNQHGDVVIDSIKKSVGRCVTTFERGDEVEAVLSGFTVMIVNSSYIPK